jgi:hypothetical protein
MYCARRAPALDAKPSPSLICRRLLLRRLLLLPNSSRARANGDCDG